MILCSREQNNGGRSENYFRYTKPKGQLPDYNAPIVLPAETRTVDDLCFKIHKTLQKDFKL